MIQTVKAAGYRDGQLVNDKEYKLLNGTYYDGRTPDAVCYALEAARKAGARIRVYYGDTETGRDWMQELDTTGTVGRSTGSIKIPLLIKTTRSTGGGSILEHCIVKLILSGRTEYVHPKYNRAALEIKPCTDTPGYTYALFTGDKLYSRHKTETSAKRLLSHLS